VNTNFECVFKLFIEILLDINSNLAVISNGAIPMNTTNPTNWDCWYEIGEMDCDKYEDMQIALYEINGSSPYQETSPIQFTIEEDLPF
jgi:hypothetical protein